MFESQYEKRLESWATFRESLEESEDPFRDLIAFYKQAPYVSIHTDPWNSDTWPNPWELIYENQYDDFCRVLGMCYSLQLTDRFKGSIFEIHICIVNNISHLYLLKIDDYFIGIDEDDVFLQTELPKDIESHQTYKMPGLQ